MKEIEHLRRENKILKDENQKLLRDNIELAQMVAHRTTRLALMRWFLRIPGSRWLFLKGY